MPEVFISYSRADAHAAEVISEEMKKIGVPVFNDERVLVGGSDFTRHVDMAFQAADTIVVLLSRNSKRSRWVEEELTRALETKKTVVPVLLDEDGKNNWVWPLLADRQPIERKDSESLETVAEKVARVVLKAWRREGDNLILERQALDVRRKLLGTGVVAAVVLMGSLGLVLWNNLAQQELQTRELALDRLRVNLLAGLATIEQSRLKSSTS